ncbi:MAG: hypothetical protein HRU28_13480 [Rhizobiales bacterium]|nr:hypothetical protein [Hyphomicrobiales bacterium]
MTDYSKYSDDEINDKMHMHLKEENYLYPGYFYTSDRGLCMDILINNKFEFIPLEDGYEVRTYDHNGKPIIAQNKNPFRAICECYLMQKEGS